jgi:hypothetical protein
VRFIVSAPAGGGNDDAGGLPIQTDGADEAAPDHLIEGDAILLKFRFNINSLVAHFDCKSAG